MIYLFAFIFFMLFVGSLAIGLIFRGQALKSEDEAAAALEGLNCAACSMNCGFAGHKKHKPGKNCQADLRIEHKQV